MVIFPYDGVRISATKNFMWEKNTFELKYYDYNIEQEFNGPKLFSIGYL